ncbi:MAG: preprotein translocase subunit SecE [Bacilli bacterium]
MFAKLGQFFKNLRSEMRKVSWPKRQELVNSTLVVLGTVIVFGVFFFAVDLGISEVIKLFTAK